jgi:hypothetical protein
MFLFEGFGDLNIRSKIEAFSLKALMKLASSSQVYHIFYVVGILLKALHFQSLNTINHFLLIFQEFLHCYFL